MNDRARTVSREQYRRGTDEAPIKHGRGADEAPIKHRRGADEASSGLGADAVLMNGGVAPRRPAVLRAIRALGRCRPVLHPEDWMP